MPKYAGSPTSVNDAIVLRRWVLAYMHKDFDVETMYEDRALDIVLSQRTDPKAFHELVPLLSRLKDQPYVRHSNLIMKRAFMNPACPRYVLELGFNSGIRVYKNAVLMNPAAPDEWKVTAFLNGTFINGTLS